MAALQELSSTDSALEMSETGFAVTYVISVKTLCHSGVYTRSSDG